MIKATEYNIEPCGIAEVRDYIEKHHYSHNVNGVKITQCFKAEYNSKIIGGIIFGQLSTTAWRRFGNSEKEVLELRRLVLSDDVGKNGESRFIGYTLRWLKKNLREVKIIVSYADPYYGHTGIIYKASNFKLFGMSAKDKAFKDLDTGKIHHSRSLRTKYKGRYKPFVLKLREKKESGRLVPVDLPQKYCYIYRLNSSK